MTITTTTEQRYGKTVYIIRRAGRVLPFALGSVEYTRAEDLDITEAIAEALPAEYDVRFSAARRGVLGSEDTWSITDGDRTVAKVHDVTEIIPAALRAQAAAAAVPARPVAAPAPERRPARPKLREVSHIINHGDDHTTTYYADGSSYDTEMGWTR